MANLREAMIALAVLAAAASSQARLTLVNDADAGATDPSQTEEYRAKYKVPDGFLLGGGTGSYQSEGAWDADGKGENVFDYLYHQQGMANLSTGDVAADSYHRYKEDIALAAEMKLNVHRISISWARIFPNGRRSSRNQKGIDYYHAVIDEIIDKNMTPMVTMSHFDHPQALETEFGGWLSEQMVEVFVDYADFLLSEYGDKVHHWVTVNEPNMHCMMVYGGLLPPGYPGAPTTSDPNIYLCMHNEILAHAKAYALFQQKYNEHKKGVVGIGAVTFFSRPNSTSYEDAEAAYRANMFDLGLMLHPVVYGDYPAVVRETLNAAGKVAHLPTFTEEQKKAIKGAVDFVAVNVYFGSDVAPNKTSVASGAASTTPRKTIPVVGWRLDQNVTNCLSLDEPGQNKEVATGNVFALVTEWVMRDMLLWVKANYGPDLGIFITENGMALKETDNDDWDTRAVYHSKYLREMFRTINEDDVKVLGYTVWSFMDDFEFSAGYLERRFGVVHVDYETGSLNRTKKASAAFFQRLMEERVVPLVEPSSSSSSSSSASPILVLILVAAISRFF